MVPEQHLKNPLSPTWRTACIAASQLPSTHRSYYHGPYPLDSSKRRAGYVRPPSNLDSRTMRKFMDAVRDGSDGLKDSRRMWSGRGRRVDIVELVVVVIKKGHMEMERDGKGGGE